jgi:hypothetical protein
MKTSVERRWFNRVIAFLDRGNFVEKVNVVRTHEDGSVSSSMGERCLRLVKLYTQFPVGPDSYQVKKQMQDPEKGQVLGEGGLLIDLPLEYQIVRLIELSAEKGTTTGTIQRSMNNIGIRLLDRALRRIQKDGHGKPSKVKVEFEFEGRERRYRYYSKEVLAAAKQGRMTEASSSVLMPRAPGVVDSRHQSKRQAKEKVAASPTVIEEPLTRSSRPRRAVTQKSS